MNIVILVGVFLGEGFDVWCVYNCSQFDMDVVVLMKCGMLILSDIEVVVYGVFFFDIIFKVGV